MYCKDDKILFVVLSVCVKSKQIVVTLKREINNIFKTKINTSFSFNNFWGNQNVFCVKHFLFQQNEKKDRKKLTFEEYL